jgi:hypothetical protein
MNTTTARLNRYVHAAPRRGAKLSDLWASLAFTAAILFAASIVLGVFS